MSQSADRVAVLDARARQAFVNSHTSRRQRLASLTKLLQSLSYHGVLARGFALVRDQTGAMVRRSEGLHTGHNVEIEFSDGRVAARVLKASHQRRDEPGPHDRGKGARRRCRTFRRGGSPSDPQGPWSGPRHAVLIDEGASTAPMLNFVGTLAAATCLDDGARKGDQGTLRNSAGFFCLSTEMGGEE